MSESIYLIYKHTSPSGKSYIGQTNDLTRRNREHKRAKNSKCCLFNNAINKYGWDNFTHEVLLDNLDVDAANEMEAKLIAEHNTLAPSGYNLTSGGQNYIRSEETKRKMSEWQKGKAKDYPVHNKGIPLSDTHKQKLSENSARKNKPGTMMGVRHSEEAKQKISKSKIGTKWGINKETGKREYYKLTEITTEAW